LYSATLQKAGLLRGGRDLERTCQEETHEDVMEISSASWYSLIKKTMFYIEFCFMHLKCIFAGYKKKD
jgi:hypothetical protein